MELQQSSSVLWWLDLAHHQLTQKNSFQNDGTPLSPQNHRMQQPLCHIYFLTVMEHLWSKHCNVTHGRLSILVTVIKDIQKQLHIVQGGEAVLLYIELQAVIQILIQQLALHLDPSQMYRLGDVQPLLHDINQ